MAAKDNVIRIEMGEGLKAPRPGLSTKKVQAPSPTLRKIRTKSGKLVRTTGGKHVLIGIIDVGGFDFAHPDFRDATSTRFVRIWDQGGLTARRRPDSAMAPRSARNIWTRRSRPRRKKNFPRQLLEPQSQQEFGSHGTHVASIAAGNRGVCPSAFLAGVLIDLPEADLDRRQSFYDSTRIAHAVEYLFDLGEELRKLHKLERLPVSINVSLGTNGHAHDGSSSVNRWLDSALTVPGRRDFGRGRERRAGKARVRERLRLDHGADSYRGPHSFARPGQGHRVGSDRQRPGGRVGKRNGDLVQPGRPIRRVAAHSGRRLDRSGAAGSVHREPAGRQRVVFQHLQRDVSSGQRRQLHRRLPQPVHVVGETANYWHPVREMGGPAARRGGPRRVVSRLDQRDDPGEVGPVGEQSLWHFPSYFTADSNIDESSISSLGCGHNVVCVANLDEPSQKINISSSQGPTRDGRFKPDVAAPGTDIVAALGFNFDDDEEWVAMTGTSMASPYVTGVVGLMLAENPKLTAAQICGILQRAAKPLPGVDYKWRNEAGYGIIDPAGCLDEVKFHLKPRDIT